MSKKPILGRPRKLASPDDFLEKAERYFQDCENSGVKPRVTRLALAVGLSGKQALDAYQKREDFSDVVRAAKSIVEASYEDALSDGNPAGAIFALKNFGWTDKPETAEIADAATSIKEAVERLTREK